MAEEAATSHTKHEGSVGIFTGTSAPKLLITTAAQPILQNMMLRGKPLEDLDSVAAATLAGLNRPLVRISQEQDVETDYNRSTQNEAASLQHGMITHDDFATAQQISDSQLPLSEGGNRIADTANVNNHTSGITSNSAATVQHDFSSVTNAAIQSDFSFYQQQCVLNAQLFVQQQQTVNTLIGKVDELSKKFENTQQSGASVNENTRVKQITRKEVIRQKTHALSDSDLEDVSEASENEESDVEDNYAQSDSDTSQNQAQENSEGVSENMKMLLELGKELEKSESVSKKVDDTLSKVVNSGIRSMIDRNLAKELCGKYNRPDNCKALVKINKELWNTTSLAKITKEKDKMCQTAQKYLNQGLIPLVQLTENLLKGKDKTNFKLAQDSLQLLAYAHRDLSNIRRQQLKAVVADKYKPLCHDSTPLTENLLGDDLEKQIKTMDEMRKVGKDLTKHRAEKRKRYSDSYEKASKHPRYNSYSGYNYKNKDKGPFLEKKSRYQHKPGPAKKKNHKQ